MATAVVFYAFKENLAEKVHNLASDTLKVALTNTGPTASTNTVLADITQIANGNGYTTGGTQATQSSSSLDTSTYELVVADVVFTASGSVGPFRYTVFYNDTPTSPADPLILYHDYGSSITLASGETFTWDASATTGIVAIT